MARRITQIIRIANNAPSTQTAVVNAQRSKHTHPSVNALQRVAAGIRSGVFMNHPFRLHSIRFASSSSSSSTGDSSVTFASSSLKALIKPFILKCHPDMAQQQGLPKTAQKVNLVAIQNLNSYIDGVNQFLKTGKYPFAVPSSSTPSNGTDGVSLSDGLIEIEFVMALSNHPAQGAATTATTTMKAGQNPTTSRRKVELQVPPPTMPPSRTAHHVQRQVIKLLRMADLPVPAAAASQLPPLDDDDDEKDVDPSHYASRRRVKKSPWEESRDRFWRRINWKQFDTLYEDALQDARAHILTRNMIRDSPKLRHQLLAKVLSNVRFDDSVQPLERLVAYRRFLRLLDGHFDDLHLEDFGKYWEELTIRVVPARAFNTSTSAMRKRRQRNLETGYSFTIHHDNTVSVQVPVDFDNNELIHELRRNIADFVAWTQQETSDLENLGLFSSWVES